MNFFKTVFLLCTKISALTVLKDVSAWRAWLHTALLLILCPVLLATVQLHSEKKETELILEQIRNETGGFCFAEDGSAALGNGAAEVHLAFRMLGEHARLDYVSADIPFDPDSWKENLGILVTPAHLFFWTRPVDARYSIQKLPTAMLRSYLRNETPEHTPDFGQMLKADLYSGQQFTAQVQEHAGTAPAKDAPLSHPVPLEGVRTAFLTMLWMMLFAVSFQESLLLVLIGALTFSFVQTMRFRLLPNRLKYSKVLALTLYAAFPALLIATLLTATGQQILMFQTIFFPVFFVYQLMSFNCLMGKMNPLPGGSDNSNDEES